MQYSCIHFTTTISLIYDTTAIGIKDTSEKSGTVYCKFKVTCNEVKREETECENLVVRTTTAKFVDDDTDG